MNTEKRLTMALSVLVALMMLAVPLASSSNLFVDGGQTNSNGDAPVLSDNSSNDNITIKDVYIVKTADELKALPIYDYLKTQTGYKENEISNSIPLLVTVYTVSDKVKGQSVTDLKDGEYHLNFTINYGGTDYDKGYSGITDKLKDSEGNYYYIAPLNKNSGDFDKLSIAPSNYYQTYTVKAQLYGKDSKAVTGSEVSKTSGAADNVKILETWMIDDQNSFNKIKDYGKDLNDFINGGKWGDNRNPWVAVAFTTSSPGSVTLNISAAHDLADAKPFTMYFREAGTYVFVATVGTDQDGGTGDKLGMDSSNWNNNIFYIEATGTDGSKSVGSVTYGSVSGTYDVIFKLNSDDKSLDMPVTHIPGGVNDKVSWKINADGDLVASVTISDTSKVSVEYLITKIFNQINRNGYTLTEWSSDDGNYTNMSYGTYTDSTYTLNGNKLVDKNMTFTADWELNEGFVEAPIHVYQDDALVGDFIKTYDLSEKNTILVNSTSLVNAIKNATGINTWGIVVNGATDANNATVKEVYSSKVTYGNDSDLPANGSIASNSELTVNYNLNDRLYSKIVVHSEAFKDGKDVTLFALKNADYTYSNVFFALQKESKDHGIKAALLLGGLDDSKNAVTKDNYYLLTGWNNGAELLDSSRNAPSELTLDSKLNGYNVIFMVNGQFEVVYIPYGELSADKCTIANGVKYWSYMKYTDGYYKDTFNNINTFSFTKSQIDVIEKIGKNTKDALEPVAVFIGSAYSFNNTAYAVFDAGEGNFGNQYVDKLIVSGKASSETTKTTIPMPEVSPVYENTVVLVGYGGYFASGDDASYFEDAKSVQSFTANVINYKYTITFYNGSEVNGIFYYSDVSTVTDTIFTNELVAFSHKGTAYDIEADYGTLTAFKEFYKEFYSIFYPEKDGYKVTQWKDADGKVMLDKVVKVTTTVPFGVPPSDVTVDVTIYEVNFKKISSDMNFYANFEAEEYLIAYNGNTATMTNNMPQIGTVDSAVNLFSDAAFSNDGYEIKEWNTRPDGKGTSYALGSAFTLTGEQYKDLKGVPTGIGLPESDYEKGLTLYAIWDKSSSGSGSGDNNDKDSGNTDTYLLAGILIVIIILIIVVAVVLKRKQ